MSFGQASLDRMVDEGSLETCAVDSEGADRLVAKAHTHLSTAAAVSSSDPETALDALHAGNRKALEAVLLKRGLRPTKLGGHLAAGEAVEAMLGRGSLAVYGTVRRLRHEGDYHNANHDVHPDDVTDNLSDSHDLVDACEKVIRKIPVYIYGQA